MGTRKVRVLVVEDSLSLADMICDQLVEQGMEPVGPVATVEGALRLVRESELDLAVLDIKLRNETCFPVCRALAARRIPFLFVTGTKMQEFPAEFRTMAVLTKPFDPGALKLALGILLGTGADPAGLRLPNAQI